MPKDRSRRSIYHTYERIIDASSNWNYAIGLGMKITAKALDNESVC